MTDQAQQIDPKATDGYDSKGRHYTISHPSADTIMFTYDDTSTMTQTLDGHIVSESVLNPPSPSDPPGTPTTRTTYEDFDSQNQPHAADGPDGPDHHIVHYTIDYNAATGETIDHFPTHTLVERNNKPETDSGTDAATGLHYDTTFTSSGTTTRLANGDVYQYATDGRPIYQEVVSPAPKGSPPGTPDTVVKYTSFVQVNGQWVPTGGSDNIHGDFTVTSQDNTRTTHYTAADITDVSTSDGHPITETGTDKNGHYVTTYTATGSTTTYDSGPAKGSIYQNNMAGDPVFQQVVSPPPKGSPPGTPDTVTKYTSFVQINGEWVPNGGSDNIHGDFTITRTTGGSAISYTDGTVMVEDANGNPISETGTDANGHYLTNFTATGWTTTYDSGQASGSIYKFNSDGTPTWQQVVSPPPKGAPPGTPSTVTTYTSFTWNGSKWVPTAGTDNINGAFTISYDSTANTSTVTYNNGTIKTFDQSGRILSSTMVKTDANGNKVTVKTTYDYNRPNGEYVATTGDQHTLYDANGVPIKKWTGNDESKAKTYTPGLNGHYFLTDPDGTKTEYDINGNPITTWDKNGKVTIDWGLQPQKLDEAYQGAKKASDSIDNALTGLQTVFNNMTNVWDAPSQSTFDPLAKNFMKAVSNLQSVLADAVKRLNDTKQNYLAVESTNASDWQARSGQ